MPAARTYTKLTVPSAMSTKTSEYPRWLTIDLAAVGGSTELAEVSTALGFAKNARFRFRV